MHPLKLILSNLLRKPDFLFCHYGFQDVLELSNLLQMYWLMIKSFSGEANSKYYSPLILLLFFCWCSKIIKCFFLVNFLYPANDILTKTWKSICFKCKSCFPSKNLPHLQNQKIEKTKRDLSNYNPSNQATNPPSFLYEATDL